MDDDHVLRGMPGHPRRLAQVHMTPDGMLRWLSSGERVVVSGLPEGASLVNCAYDFFTHTIVLTVEHETFPEVHPGQLAPVLPATLVRATDDDGE